MYCTVDTCFSSNTEIKLTSLPTVDLNSLSCHIPLSRRSVGKDQALGVKAAAVQADAGHPNFGKLLVAAALENFHTDTINIVVNNAGLGITRDGITSVPLKDWDYLFHINIRGPFSAHPSRAAIHEARWPHYQRVDSNG